MYRAYRFILILQLYESRIVLYIKHLIGEFSMDNNDTSLYRIFKLSRIVVRIDTQVYCTFAYGKIVILLFGLY